jgi:hypothetical protein
MGLRAILQDLLPLGASGLARYYAGLDGEGVREVLKHHRHLRSLLLAAGPQIEARFPGANPTLTARRSLPTGSWSRLSLRLETDLSARGFAAAWEAFDREWWGRATENLESWWCTPVPVYRTPPHDARDVVDRFFERREGVDAFLDAHPAVCEVLATGVGALAARYPRGYGLTLAAGPHGPWLRCSQDQPGMPGWGDSPELRALRETWGPIAAAAPDFLDPEPALVRYVV